MTLLGTILSNTIMICGFLWLVNFKKAFRWLKSGFAVRLHPGSELFDM